MPIDLNNPSTEELRKIDKKKEQKLKKEITNNIKKNKS